MIDIGRTPVALLMPSLTHRRWMDRTQPRFPRSRLSDVIGANEEMFLSDRAFISDLSLLRARSLCYIQRSTWSSSVLLFSLQRSLLSRESYSLFLRFKIFIFIQDRLQRSPVTWKVEKEWKEIFIHSSLIFKETHSNACMKMINAGKRSDSVNILPFFYCHSRGTRMNQESTKTRGKMNFVTASY